MTGPEATFLKAQEALRSRRWQEAADQFANLIATSSRFSVEARLGLADSQKALGESKAALKTLLPLIADEGTADPRAELLAAEIYLSESNNLEAETLLSRVKTNSRKTELEKLCLYGELALKEGKLTDAADAFTKVLAEPEDRTLRMVSVARLGLAKVLIQKQEYDEAENELEKLISDEPGSPVLSDLFENLFEIYSKENNPETSELARWARGKSRKRGAGSPGVRALLSRTIAASAESNYSSRRKLSQPRSTIPQSPDYGRSLPDFEPSTTRIRGFRRCN